MAGDASYRTRIPLIDSIEYFEQKSGNNVKFWSYNRFTAERERCSTSYRGYSDRGSQLEVKHLLSNELGQNQVSTMKSVIR